VEEEAMTLKLIRDDEARVERAWSAYIGSIQNAHSNRKWETVSDAVQRAAAEAEKTRCPAEYAALRAALAAADEGAVVLDDAARERMASGLNEAIQPGEFTARELVDAAIKALTDK
jgi:hypothetical protein